jgi:hypothetical protein
MTDAERIEDIRRKSVSTHGAGYHYPNSGCPSEACYDIRFLLEQLDKATMALEQFGGCDRCDERDRHEAEAEDGMCNAAEIAGLQ